MSWSADRSRERARSLVFLARWSHRILDYPFFCVYFDSGVFLGVNMCPESCFGVECNRSRLIARKGQIVILLGHFPAHHSFFSLYIGVFRVFRCVDRFFVVVSWFISWFSSVVEHLNVILIVVPYHIFGGYVWFWGLNWVSWAWFSDLNVKER